MPRQSKNISDFLKINTTLHPIPSLSNNSGIFFGLVSIQMCSERFKCILIVPFLVVLMLCGVASAAIEVSSTSGVFLEEVPFGETAVLKCRSNDEYHNFDYWLLNNGAIIIGPANAEYDDAKFKYEVLSGNLTVKRVSQQEEGLYSCVSKAVRGNNIKIERVKMLVISEDWVDWEEAYEHDPYINTIRVLIILITLVLLGIGGYVVFRIWKDRFRHPSYLEQDDDDESGEEIFRSPGGSGISRSRSPGRIVVDKDKERSSGNLDVSTDFENFLDASNKN